MLIAAEDAERRQAPPFTSAGSANGFTVWRKQFDNI